MSNVIYVAGLVVIYGSGLLFYRWASNGRADVELREFADTVPAPLTENVRAWLAPQLYRRSWYSGLGMFAGFASTNTLFGGWEALPWAWFAVLLGVGFGITAGTLAAGLRTTPLVEGSMRTADPARRRVPDHFGPSDTLRLRFAVLVSLSALLLIVLVVATSDNVATVRSLLGCGLGVLLVAAHYCVAAAVIARPMVASTPEGLIWQQALLAKTMRPLPVSALVDAVFTAGIALYVAIQARGDLPLLVLALGGFVALLTVLAGAATITGIARRRQEIKHRLLTGRSAT